jgi:hypothetical protein
MAQLKNQGPAEPGAAKAAPGSVDAPMWTPPVPQVERKDYPDLPPSPPFLLMAHPDRWQVMGGAVVPLLGTLRLQAGVNNVSVTRNGEIRHREAQAKMEERAWQIIPWDVDGPGTSYLVEPKPGVVLEKWTKTYPRQSTTHCDVPAYVAWLLSLIARGVIAPVGLHILDKMAGNLRNDHQRALEQVHTSPVAAENAKRIAAELAVVEAEIAKRSGE